MARAKEKATLLTAPIETIPAFAMPSVRPAITVSPEARMGFMDGTDGRPRLAWARSNVSYGTGWNAGTRSPYAIGRNGNTREANLASAVANELLTSNPLIHTIVENLTTNAVGTGLTLSSKPDAERLDIDADAARDLSHQIETRWQAWAGNALECDISGRHTVHDLAQAAFRSWLLNGEYIVTLDWQAFPNTSTRTKIALLDVRQLDTMMTGIRDGRNVINGVAFDARGRRVGYYLRQIPIGAQTVQPIATFVPAFTSWGRPTVMHIFDLLDARQVRGQSPMIAALTASHEKESLGEFTLANALLQTSFALTVESDLPANAAFNSLVTEQPIGGGSMSDAFLSMREEWYSKSKIEPTPGVINHLSPGDKLKMNKVENPTSTFDSFDQSLTRKAARASGDSYENASGDWSKTNFSASRMAAALPHRLNVRRRKAIVQPFYQGIFSAWLEEQIETGAIALPAGAPEFWKAKDAYTNAKWLGLGMVEPDRKKAADATILELENGLVTFEDALAERGTDLETHIENLRQERELLKAAGLDHPFYPGIQNDRKE